MVPFSKLNLEMFRRMCLYSLEVADPNSKYTRRNIKKDKSNISRVKKTKT
jgi:hypothetical protein